MDTPESNTKKNKGGRPKLELKGQALLDYKRKLIEEIQLKEALRFKRAQVNFIDFIRYVKPDYIFNWHHVCFASRLDKFAKGEINKIILNCPPQHGKSLLSCILLPAFLMGLDPKLKIGICSYSAELAQSFNRECQRIMEQPEYLELFPASKLPEMKAKGAVRNAHRFETGHGGYYVSVGVGGVLTGVSLDVGIIDDAYKNSTEAASETISANTWKWFNDVFFTRFRDSGRMMCLFTRWHEDDIAGRLLQRDPEIWQKLIIPALTTEEYLLSIDGWEKPPEDTRTEIGEAIWPAWHGPAKLKKIRDDEPRTFDCLYQQTPAPADGNIIKRDWFEVRDWGQFRLPPMTWHFFVDSAYTVKSENDPSAIMAAALDDRTNLLYVRNVATVRKELPNLIKFIEEFAQANGYSAQSRIYVEPQASGHSILQAMKAETSINVAEWRYPKIHKTTMRDKDKVTKAYAIQGKLESERVKLINGQWNKNFLYECGAFPNSKHDDQVDVLIMAVFHFFFRKRLRGPRIV